MDDKVKARAKKSLQKLFKDKFNCSVNVVEKAEGFYVNHSCEDLRDLGMEHYHYAKTWNDGYDDVYFYPVKMVFHSV